MLDFGGYSINNVTEKVPMNRVVSRLEEKNYVVSNSEKDYNQDVVSVQFVPKSNFHAYYYKLMSGNDFSKAQKGKCCLFVTKSEWTWLGWQHESTPYVGEVYWSGEIKDGYIHGKGAGLNLSHLTISDKDQDATGYFYYFEGEYIYGIPVSEVKSYDVEMKDVKRYGDINPYTYTKKDANYFLVEHKDKLDAVMLDNFISGDNIRYYEQYKALANDVRNILDNFKREATEIILNETTPQLSQHICGYFMGSDFSLFKTGTEEGARRNTLQAFKSFEGIEMSIMEDKYKQLLLDEQKPLLAGIDEALKYMDLLDGLALTSEELIQEARFNYNVSLLSFYGSTMLDHSNYYSLLDNAEKIAKELKNSSSGTLREKYAAAEKKLSDWHKTIIRVKNDAYAEAVRRQQTPAKSSSSSSSNKDDWKEKMNSDNAGYYILKEITDSGSWSGGRFIDSDDDFEDSRTVQFSNGKEVKIYWEHRVKKGINRYGFVPKGLFNSMVWYNDFDNAIIGAYLYKYENKDWDEGRQR